MAIYHLHAQAISRSAGRCIVQAAAYRAAEELDLERTGESFDFTRKKGVEHTEILVPEGAPEWATDRAKLWNAVEDAEKRVDAQLAREIEVSLPVELTREQQIELVREFAREGFVKHGMVADIAIHRDNRDNPHAHILLTTRSIDENGFGPKNRDWNDKRFLIDWREQWAALTNQHLARAGFEINIDHRSHEARGILLEPGQKLGLDVTRQTSGGLPDFLQERVDRQADIMRENGERIIAEPQIALDVLTQQQATFTSRDVARFLNTHTYDTEQFERAQVRVMGSPEVVKVGVDDRGESRYSTVEMLNTESAMLDRAGRMAETDSHRVNGDRVDKALAKSGLSQEQGDAARHVLAAGELKTVVGVAGSGKSRMLDSARQAWEAQGYTVKGAALAGKAAEGLQQTAGIESRTLASYELSWKNGRDGLSSKDVLVIDEAGMLGTRQLARVLDRAEQAGAKVVLVGDAEQLQPIDAGSPFRAISTTIGTAEIAEVRRQHEDWQRQATSDFAAGRTDQALTAYRDYGAVVEAGSREEARSSVLAAWDMTRDRGTQIMLAYTNDDVRALNDGARALLKERGELSQAEQIETARGGREFATGDRLLFLRNEKSLGVKNGTLGTVEKMNDGRLTVRLDTADEKGRPRRVEVDSRYYNDVDHGYATTIHKSQGTTVDRTYVMGSKFFDRHAAYVALSRHRVEARLFYAKDDFKTFAHLKETFSRARHKDMALNYGAARGYQPSSEDRRIDAGLLQRGEQAFQERFANFEKLRDASVRTAEKTRVKPSPEIPLPGHGRGR